MSYYRPQDMKSAVALMAEPGARALAGGTDLYPATERPALDGVIVDLSAVDGFRGIAQEDGGLRIGAGTTWTAVAQADLPPALEALQEAAREVGSRQIQNAGTIGGNLCNASPAADGVPPLMVVGAEVEVSGPGGMRRLPVERFVLGNRKTDLAQGELVSGVWVPDQGLGGASAFEKLGARRHLVISIAMVAARISIAGGRIAEAAVCVGACSAVALRMEALEHALVGAARGDVPAVVQAAEMAGLQPLDDIRADQGYRLHAARVLAERAVLRAFDRAEVLW